MKKQENYAQIMPEGYGISHRGILPCPDPLTKLPSDFGYYDEFGRQLPDFLGAGIVRNRIKELPFPARPLTTLSFDEKMLLMLRLSFIVSAHVNQDSYIEFTPKRTREKLQTDKSQIVIPANIALPFTDVAEDLKIPSILSYTFYSPYNWERIDKGGPIVVSNLLTIQGFLGGLDERHFILLHTEIELALGSALYYIPDLFRNTLRDLPQAVGSTLETMAQSIENAKAILERMTESCHPDIYYLRVRPYIFGFNIEGSGRNVIFEGLPEGKKMPVLRGETGAQTPSFPAIWAAMGIEFSDDHLKQHVLAMRDYMLPKHRAYIEAIERGPSIRQFVLTAVQEKREGAKELKDAYNRAIMALYKYFRLHRYYAYIYIDRKAKKYTLHQEQGAYGTGGTRYMQYLTKH